MVWWSTDSRWVVTISTHQSYQGQASLYLWVSQQAHTVALLGTHSQQPPASPCPYVCHWQEDGLQRPRALDLSDIALQVCHTSVAKTCGMFTCADNSSHVHLPPGLGIWPLHLNQRHMHDRVWPCTHRCMGNTKQVL
jgi:hypothetical protein